MVAGFVTWRDYNRMVNQTLIVAMAAIVRGDTWSLERRDGNMSPVDLLCRLYQVIMRRR